jgi:quinol monooxygenase YgiN
MTFVQMVEMRSRDIDELRALYEGWKQATRGIATLRRSLLTQDRSDPQQFMIIAFFESYDAAMANSALPETTALAESVAALADGPLDFHDLDVIDDHTETEQTST